MWSPLPFSRRRAICTSAWLFSLSLNPGAGVYPTDWDATFASGRAAMDAILFPDPQAPDDVVHEAALQCLSTPHVMIVGTNAKKFLGDQKFDCLFDAPNGEALRTEGTIYPKTDAECPTRVSPQHNKPRDQALICKVPASILRAGGKNVRVVLIDPTSGRKISKQLLAQGLWNNGENAETVKPRRKYRLALTHMYKNHGPQIVRWIEWHLAKGVEHFFLYDNNSEDDDAKYTESFEKQGIVTRIAWPFCCAGIANNAGQRGTLNHALHKFGQVVDWLISLDSDEFIVSEPGRSNIVDILDNITDSSTEIVGMAHSRIVRPGCDPGRLQREKGVVLFGDVPTSKACPPNLTTLGYPGKQFVRPIRAYNIGFFYFTPHPLISVPHQRMGLLGGEADAMDRVDLASGVEDLDWTQNKLSAVGGQDLHMMIAHFRHGWSDAMDKKSVPSMDVKPEKARQGKNREKWFEEEFNLFLQKNPSGPTSSPSGPTGPDREKTGRSGSRGRKK